MTQTAAMNLPELLILRHGETEWNAAGRIGETLAWYDAAPRGEGFKGLRGPLPPRLAAA